MGTVTRFCVALAVVFAWGSAPAQAQWGPERAPINYASPTYHYRIWEGYMRDFSIPAIQYTPAEQRAMFLRGLPGLMRDTIQIYRRDNNILRNYIVVVPPATKPSYIPDEMALVALTSEADYQRVRATPLGQAYGPSHGTIFDMARSRSARYGTGWLKLPEVLEEGTGYDVIGAPVNWEAGYTMVFIGSRKAGISSQDFLLRLTSHVRRAGSLFLTAPGHLQALLGYVVTAHSKDEGGYELAYMNWSSKEAAEAAFATQDGKELIAEAGSIMDTVMFAELGTFGGGSVESGQFYSTAATCPDWLRGVVQEHPHP